MFNLYILMGFLTLIPIGYGFWCFKRLGAPCQVIVIGTTASFCLWLYSYLVSTLKLGSTSLLHYFTPVLYSLTYSFFYRITLRPYRWSRFLVVLPVIVILYTAIDLYLNGQRIMAIDLMSHVNLAICILSLTLFYLQMKQSSNMKRSGIVWMNGAFFLSAFLGFFSNILLNRLFQYQNNEWFSLIYYGFWAFMGSVNTGLITYSLILESNKLPSLEAIPNFESF